MEDNRSAFVVKAGLDDVESRSGRLFRHGHIRGFDAFMEGRIVLQKWFRVKQN